MLAEVKWRRDSLVNMLRRVLIPMSAGTKPTSQVNPLAIQVMNEIGIDISKQRSKDLTEDMMRNSNKIINMGCMDKNFCPTLFIPKLIDWGILSLDSFPK